MENLVELPLDEILRNNGYFEKREKSSQNYKTLTNENSDTIVISRQQNGHYLYFNPNDDKDKGNIYNFAKNRGIKASDLIDTNNINKIKELKSSIKPVRNSNQNSNKIIDNYKKMNNVDKNSFFVSKRKLNIELLSKFSFLRQDEKYKNVVVPTYTLASIQTKNGNKEYLRQTGTISYLSSPITQDPQGKPYNKPIKQLCNGNKGLEVLKADDANKNPKEFKNIVVCESMIDTLSYAQINNINLKETLLCSTNGQISQSQKIALKTLQKLAPNAKFLLGFDNDDRGKEFYKIVEEIIPNTKRITPILKDFSDDLVIGKELGLDNKDINKESLLKPINDFKKNVEYLQKKYDILEPYAKDKKVKELFSQNIAKFKEIEPKVRCIQGMRECYKRLNILENKISRDYSKSR